MALPRRLLYSVLYFITSTACLVTTHCGDGKWGERCGKTCPSGCAPLRDVVHCDKLNGCCLEGCIPGLFGDTCTSTCSADCMNGNCDQVDGRCVQCKEGCFGPVCENCSSKQPSSTVVSVQMIPTVLPYSTHVCSNGTWGDNCDKPCSRQCMQYSGRSCNETTGFCLNDCIRSFYGERCDQMCSRSCENSVCQHSNGMCVSCKKGQHVCGETQTSGAVPKLLNGTVGYAMAGMLFVLVTIILVFQCRRHQQGNNRHTRRGVNAENDTHVTSQSYPSEVHHYDVLDGQRYWEINEAELEDFEHRTSSAEGCRCKDESAETTDCASPREKCNMGNKLMEHDECVSLQSTDEHKTVALFHNIVCDASGVLYLKDNSGDISVRYLTAKTTD